MVMIESAAPNPHDSIFQDFEKKSGWTLSPQAIAIFIEKGRRLLRVEFRPDVDVLQSPIIYLQGEGVLDRIVLLAADIHSLSRLAINRISHVLAGPHISFGSLDRHVERNLASNRHIFDGISERVVLALYLKVDDLLQLSFDADRTLGPAGRSQTGRA